MEKNSKNWWIRCSIENRRWESNPAFGSARSKDLIIFRRPISPHRHPTCWKNFSIASCSATSTISSSPSASTKEFCRSKCKTIACNGAWASGGFGERSKLPLTSCWTWKLLSTDVVNTTISPVCRTNGVPATSSTIGDTFQIFTSASGLTRLRSQRGIGPQNQALTIALAGSVLRKQKRLQHFNSYSTLSLTDAVDSIGSSILGLIWPFTSHFAGYISLQTLEKTLCITKNYVYAY